MVEWMVREGGSEPIGPVTTELVIRGILAGRVAQNAEVCRLGDNSWRRIDSVPEFAGYTLDDDAQTHVTDSPWFAGEPSSARRAPLGPPPKLPPVGLAPLQRSRPAPPPARTGPPRRAAPPPRAPTLQSASSTPLAGQHGYDAADDDAETRVADSSQFLPRAPEFQVDDETMTHVATNPSDAPVLAPSAVRPTLPMPAPLEPTLDRPISSPRPAAGAPPATSLPGQELGEGLASTRVYGPVAALNPSQAPGFGGPAASGFPAPQGAFPVPPGAQPPAAQGYFQGYYPQNPQGMPPYPHSPPQVSPPEHDQGLRALVALILFLAVALAVVLILLFVRR